MKKESAPTSPRKGASGESKRVVTFQSLLSEMDRCRKQHRIWEEVRSFLERIEQCYSDERARASWLRLADGRLVEVSYFHDVLSDVDILISDLEDQISNIERVEVAHGKQ